MEAYVWSERSPTSISLYAVKALQRLCRWAGSSKFGYLLMTCSKKYGPDYFEQDSTVLISLIDLENTCNLTV